MYAFTSHPGFCGHPLPNTDNYNTNLVDTASIDPALEAYQRQSMDTSTRSSEPSLALNYTYLDTSYVSSQSMSQLHSPVPLHLSHLLPQTNTLHQATPGLSVPAISQQQIIYPSTPIDTSHSAVQSAASIAPNPVDYYAATPQLLFPTPSELLTDLASVSVSPSSHHRLQSHHRGLPEIRSHTRSPRPPQTSRHQTPEAAYPVPPASTVNKTESQRKARQRAVAEEIGFTPTDPCVPQFSISLVSVSRPGGYHSDTISSHEKKRHYLECLEQYVLYLHEQLRLVQTQPLTLERVSTYRGLSSRSIRTLLVHMQNTNRTLHESTLVEEQVFLDLSTQVMTAHNAGLPLRRHSVDVVGMSNNPGYPSEPCVESVSPIASDGTCASASPSSVEGSPVSPDVATGLGMQSSTEISCGSFSFPGAGGGI
ncbi:hypothetical protein BS17DRAFT_743325 [Gyrodon lividus]|nr:hypothetical protein BS17DRAFT_743325 [Gyrodon lividus]